MKMLQLVSDLKVESEGIKIWINSDDDEIRILVESESIPKFNLPIRKLYGFYRSMPLNTDQLVTIVYNQKEIYRSDKSPFTKFNFPFFLKVILKNIL